MAAVFAISASAAMKTSGPFRSRSSPMKRKSRASAAATTGSNSLRLEPVEDDGGRPDGRTDLGGVGVGLELADEDEGIGHPPEHALGGKIDAARRRFRVVVQAAAVGRVDAGYARTRCPQESADGPRVGAAFGAVGMQDIGIE